MNTVRIAGIVAPAAAVPARRRAPADNESRFARRGLEPWLETPSVAQRALFALLAAAAGAAVFAGVLALFAQAGA